MPKEIYEHAGTAEEHIIATNPESLTVESIEVNKGIFIHLKGIPFPQKGLPTKEAIGAINVPKRTLREYSELRWAMMRLGTKNALKLFLGVCWPVMSPYILKYEFMTPPAQAVFTFTMTLLVEFDVPFPEARKTAKIISHIFEYDQAYRFRLQDLMSESSKEKLVNNPREEVKRLLAVNRERDYEEISSKLGKVGKLLILALWVPKVKKAFVKAIKGSTFTKWQFDEADEFWASKKRDYNYLGKSYEERNGE